MYAIRSYYAGNTSATSSRDATRWPAYHFQSGSQRMSSLPHIVSKVLILDDGAAHLDSLKAFCEETGLVGIRPPKGGANLMSILKSNSYNFV